LRDPRRDELFFLPFLLAYVLLSSVRSAASGPPGFRLCFVLSAARTKSRPNSGQPSTSDLFFSKMTPLSFFDPSFTEVCPNPVCAIGQHPSPPPPTPSPLSLAPRTSCLSPPFLQCFFSQAFYPDSVVSYLHCLFLF